VRRRISSWARPIAGPVALTLVLASGAPLATASENEIASPAAQGTTLRASARSAASAKPLPPRALAQATSTPAPAPDSGKGFFGTTAGRLAIAVMAAGTGYMVYSAFKDNDPVKSVFRD
jgi:hypothetical protein